MDSFLIIGSYYFSSFGGGCTWVHLAVMDNEMDMFLGAAGSVLWQLKGDPGVGIMKQPTHRATTPIPHSATNEELCYT